MGSNYAHKVTYSLDVVFCIDSTMSMQYMIGEVTQNALHFYDDLARKMEEMGKCVDKVRVHWHMPFVLTGEQLLIGIARSSFFGQMMNRIRSTIVPTREIFILRFRTMTRLGIILLVNFHGICQNFVTGGKIRIWVILIRLASGCCCSLRCRSKERLGQKHPMHGAKYETGLMSFIEM